jgi:hypothetical protein
VSDNGKQSLKSSCENFTKFETCTQKGDINGANATSKEDNCRKEKLRGVEYLEYFDVCNVRRKISSCGLVDEDPKCFENIKCETAEEKATFECKENEKIQCQACWNPPTNNKSTESDGWKTCNSKSGYMGRLCQTCMAGYAADSSTAMKCIKCQATEVNYLFIMLGSGIAIGFLALFIKINMDVAGSSSTSGAAQKIFLNYLQTVSLAASFPLMWPKPVTVMFDVQSSASSFGDQLMDFDCEMAKKADEMKIFLQKQIFYAILPLALLLLNTIFWILHSKFNGFKSCCFAKKQDHAAIMLSKRRLSKFKNIAKRARDTTLESQSALEVIMRQKSERDNSKMSEEINAYKAVIESRGDGTAVLLTRKLISHLHHDLNVTTDIIMKSNGTDDEMISTSDFLKLMEELKVPFSRHELLQIIHLLDPRDTKFVTIHSLVSFHRTIVDKVILSTTIIMFILYPTVARNIFKLFSCRRGLSPNINKLYLTSDLEMACYDDTHRAFLFIIGVPGIILYILGFPLLSVFAMFGGQRNTKGKVGKKEKWDDRSLFRYSMFLNGYRVDKFYWECVIALRKSLVTFIGVFFSAYGVHLQSYVGLIALFAFLMYHVSCNPFAQTLLNLLETSALAVSFLTLYLGLMFWSGWLDDFAKLLLSFVIIGANVLFTLWAIRVMFATIIDEWLEGIRKKKKQKALDTRVKVTPEQRDASDLSKKKESKSIKAENVWEKSKS